MFAIGQEVVLKGRYGRIVYLVNRAEYVIEFQGGERLTAQEHELTVPGKPAAPVSGMMVKSVLPVEPAPAPAPVPLVIPDNEEAKKLEKPIDATEAQPSGEGETAPGSGT